MKPKVALILDTRREKKTGKYPVKLRLTFLRKQHYLSLGIDLSSEDFKEALQERPCKPYQALYNKLELKKRKALNIIDELQPFSFREFEIRWGRAPRDVRDIYTFFEDYINDLKKEQRIGSAISYTCSLRSLKSFAPKLGFQEIDEWFLKRYEEWMLDSGNSVTTVGIYLRNLRSIFNKAIQDGMVNRGTHYPFGKGKYIIPASRNIKKALTLEEIKKIFEYPVTSGTAEAFAKDLWIFSYLCNGMNLKDIARLKVGDIDDDYLQYQRSKTKRSTRGAQSPISVYLPPPAKAIIERWQSGQANDDYLFSILSKNITPEKELALVQQAVKQTNKYIQRIAAVSGIQKHVTTYSSRHSFATILKKSGVSTEYISESLGHTSLKTTQSYLDSFEDETKRKMAAHLFNFY